MDWLGDLFGWVDAHNGVLLFAVTIIYVVFTGKLAKQGKDSAADSAKAAQAAVDSAKAAAETAKALASTSSVLRSMIPLQFEARAVGVIHRGFTLEIRCTAAAPLVHAVRIVRVAYVVRRWAFPSTSRSPSRSCSIRRRRITVAACPASR